MHRFAFARLLSCVRRSTAAVAVLLALDTGLAMAQEQTGTLHLDADAYVSYSESATARIPSGSTIRFRFGAASADGSIPVTVRPEDVSILPIGVTEGSTIAYTLGAPATGTLRSSSGGKQIELLATLVVTLRENAEVAPVAYQLHFTTRTASATNVSQTESVTVNGVPATASNHVQLVGAATNRPDAFPGPGEAVYAILSGSFDSLPVLP